MLQKFIISLCLLVAPYAQADVLAGNTTYRVCFTPGENCTDQIIDIIDKAKSEILVQGYSFTSSPIAQALTKAKNRGISVRVILDKSQKSERYTIITYLINQQIPVWIDFKPAIAHNKILIVDGHIVQTGSFNYTKAAEKRNAENVLIIDNVQLAKQYRDNWERRLQQSIPAQDYIRKSK